MLDFVLPLKLRQYLLVSWKTNLPIYLPHKYKKKKSELAFALFRSEILVLIHDALMSAILKLGTSCSVFLRILWKTKVDLSKKSYTRFINSPWGIFERNMRVVIFWTMCYLSLGHEEKALLESYFFNFMLPKGF